MKKIFLLFLVFLFTSSVASSGRMNKPGDFKESLINLKQSADSLNTTIKKYNEKN